MDNIKPVKTIRIVAPSNSWNIDREAGYRRGMHKLEKLGYEVTLGSSIRIDDGHGSALPAKRAEDLLDAYRDKSVDVIMALAGGWLTNSILPYIDWSVVRDNPKPLIGYSDITVLLNAIYAKAGVIGYLGPNLGTLGYALESAFTLDSLEQSLSGPKDISISASVLWGEGGKRAAYPSKGWVAIQTGQARGRLIGGNLGSLYLLQGTEYMPKFNRPIILAIEDDDEPGKFSAKEFDRRLESLLQQPGARENTAGIMIGRFQVGSKVSHQDIRSIIARKQLKNIPIIADMDFGHTIPMLTLPIGGVATITVGDKIQVKLSEY